MSKKITASTSGWQNFNLNPPTVAVIGTSKTTPPLPYNIPITEDKHDLFDVKRLLKIVPGTFKHNAEVLLKEFSKSPHSLTWNSDGVIFIDDVSIPNSNIFVFFPYLFKTRYPKSLIGFDDFLEKIHEMGLSSLIKEKRKKTSSATTFPLTNHLESSSSQNWWYLGP